ncbi:chemotaxis protein CheB [Halodurantibacterium flavum]|uniref:protein-glutamate methylesterase n=1 Tax=Halodurantibacterium flavum TaxID=1382802 RepID=A0ABW4SAL1_9RHOB
MGKRIILIDRRPIRAMKLADGLRAADLVVIDAVVSPAQALRHPRLSEAEAIFLIGPARGEVERARADLGPAGPPVIPVAEEDMGGLAGADYTRVATRLVQMLRGPAPPAPELRPIVCIGASTGGVTVLEQILEAFPADCPPTMIVQHIRGSFSAGLAERLNRLYRPEVSEARTGAPLLPGHVYLAPGDQHHLEMRMQPGAQCRLTTGERVSGHRPSVDALFRSVADRAPPGVAAILTGMGRDGAQGLLQLRHRGWHTIAQDAQSSTVYGMPRVAAEIGAVDEVLPGAAIGPAILRACNRITQRHQSGQDL